MAASERSALYPTPAAAAGAWWKESVAVTFSFRCNIACTFCMVEDVLGVLPGMGLDRFTRVLEEPAQLEGIRRIIFTGGEVTLSDELFEFVARARSVPSIEHVRIQTNATRLGDEDYLRKLIDAGVDEFFVSFHAPDADTYHRIARRKAAFPMIVAGLEAIARSEAALITNTAIVQANFERLRDIVDVVAGFGPQSMELWNYWPWADPDGSRGEAARVTEIRPHLFAALERCEELSIPPTVKWFPRCLLGKHARYLDDGQPRVLLEEDYWDEQPEYACLFEGTCAEWGERCSGLSDAHIALYGWEEEALSPTSSEGAGKERAPFDILTDDAEPERGRNAAAVTWLEPMGLHLGGTLEGWSLLTVDARSPDCLVLRFTDGRRSVDVRLEPTDPERRCFARTGSLDVTHGTVPRDLEAKLPDLLHALTRRIVARDDGKLTLP